MTIPAELYQHGSQYLLFLPTLVFVVLVCCYVYLPVFYHNNIDNCYVVSDPAPANNCMVVSSMKPNFFLCALVNVLSVLPR